MTIRALAAGSLDLAVGLCLITLFLLARGWIWLTSKPLESDLGQPT